MGSRCDLKPTRCGGWYGGGKGGPSRFLKTVEGEVNTPICNGGSGGRGFADRVSAPLEDSVRFACISLPGDRQARFQVIPNLWIQLYQPLMGSRS